METLFTLTLDDVLHKIANVSYLKPEFRITNPYDHTSTQVDALKGSSIMRHEKLRNFFH